MGIIKTAMGLRGERRVSGVDSAFQRLSMFDHYRASSYATAYPNIRTIANKYMTVRPFRRPVRRPLSVSSRLAWV